ncbi:SDR family oxidoreductase [Neoactinobaculum massilliense]|uniref:SDR family oxidoreductase n=1 Tax=Neoactinobaculum massilliense TaxID=2364794 RepID=UPI000F544AA7|nr:SDR family oxidoreductase [Neoactinobaculum massilliense]
MVRTIIVTGAGSGIGKATADLLRVRGEEVIGLDLKGADYPVDLSDRSAIEAVAAQIAQTHDHIDGLVVNAGVSAQNPLALKVNYFGAIDTIEVFKALLEKSEAPRISVTASAASLQPSDPKLLELLLAGKREEAIARGQELTDQGGMTGYFNYSTSKRAIAQWVRRQAPTDEYAGKGIPINAVGPGVVETPMTKELLATEEGRKATFAAMPAPLNGASHAEDIAALHAFLVSAEFRTMTGQIIYMDSGFDTLRRGEDIWHAPKSMED